jgi:hypothetical protein
MVSNSNSKCHCRESDVGIDFKGAEVVVWVVVWLVSIGGGRGGVDRIDVAGGYGASEEVRR